jgi:hypothetical protein
MKPRIAKISLAVAIVLFFGGFGMLCACPGFYVLAAVFEGVAACLSAGRMRVWSLVLTRLAKFILVLALACSIGLHWAFFNRWPGLPCWRTICAATPWLKR